MHDQFMVSLHRGRVHDGEETRDAGHGELKRKLGKVDRLQVVSGRSSRQRLGLVSGLRGADLRTKGHGLPCQGNLLCEDFGDPEIDLFHCTVAELQTCDAEQGGFHVSASILGDD
jgi:hypothetical protein